MKVTFFGHNCFLLKGQNVSIISDPWLSDQGAFFGSWFQWPINHHCTNQLINELREDKKTLLYISHEHQDHFDKKTLTLIKPYVSMCIIPKYHDSFLKKELSSIGFEIIELEDQKKFYFSKDDFIELMIVDTGVNHDSTAIISIDNETFVNQNDCKIFDRLAYLEHRKVDYYALQFSGATWHPVCYSMEEDIKKKISKKKVMAKLVAVRNAINLIKPKYYLPSAGPAVFPFLDEDLSLGKDNIFIHQPDIVKFFRNSYTQVVCMYPGEMITQSLNNAPINPPTIRELKGLKQNLSCMFSEYSDQDFDINSLKKQISLRLQKINNLKFSLCPLLIFKWGQYGLLINLNNCTINDVLIDKFDWSLDHMCVEAVPAYFALMGNPRYRWQDIYLSLRATVHRNPDVFNTFINIFLFSDISNIRSGFETTLNINDERIVIIDPNNGKNYEINRFCPHNGADLRDAKIDQNGNLICPRHSWSFNLEQNGRCENAKVSLQAREIEMTISLCETISTRLLKIDR